MLFGNIRDHACYSSMKDISMILDYFASLYEFPAEPVRLDGNRVVVTPAVFVPKEQADWVLEAHLDCIEIHYIIDGCEKILINSFDKAIPLSNPNTPQYTSLYQWVQPCSLVLHPGDFLVLWPQDAHRTDLNPGGIPLVRKLIAKIYIPPQTELPPERNVVCFGDSNTYGYLAETGLRLPYEKRWTGVASRCLGSRFHICEEGMCGRTAAFDDPDSEDMNGLAHISSAILTHDPVDILVIMLGSNDVKEAIGATAEQISQGIFQLIDRAKKVPMWAAKSPLRILLIAPPPFQPDYRNGPYGEWMGEGCLEKTLILPKLLQKVAETTGCEFLDAGKWIHCSAADGIHFDEAAHEKLGRIVADKIRKMAE